MPLLTRQVIDLPDDAVATNFQHRAVVLAVRIIVRREGIEAPDSSEDMEPLKYGQRANALRHEHFAALSRRAELVIEAGNFCPPPPLAHQAEVFFDLGLNAALRSAIAVLSCASSSPAFTASMIEPITPGSALRSATSTAFSPQFLRDVSSRAFGIMNRLDVEVSGRAQPFPDVFSDFGKLGLLLLGHAEKRMNVQVRSRFLDGCDVVCAALWVTEHRTSNQSLVKMKVKIFEYLLRPIHTD